MLNLILIENRIKARHKELNFSREMFAEQLNVIPKFCSDIESGKKGFSIQTLVKISKTLQTTTDHYW